METIATDTITDTITEHLVEIDRQSMIWPKREKKNQRTLAYFK